MKLLNLVSAIFISLFISSTVFALAQVDLNTATQKELEALPGVGPAMAKKIIDARPIKSVSDLTAATGIKDKQFDKFKDLVTVSGPAPVAATPAAAPVVEKTKPAPAVAPVATAPITEKTEKVKKSAVSKLAPGEKINLNTATLEQIEKLPGIGTKKAQSIIDARPIKNAEDVMKIKGIKQGIFNKIKDSIVL